MKAVVYSEYGPADVLQVDRVEKPVPGNDEILIRIRAGEVTKADCEMRSFNFQVKWFWPPTPIEEWRQNDDWELSSSPWRHDQRVSLRSTL